MGLQVWNTYQSHEIITNLLGWLPVPLRQCYFSYNWKCGVTSSVSCFIWFDQPWDLLPLCPLRSLSREAKMSQHLHTTVGSSFASKRELSQCCAWKGFWETRARRMFWGVLTPEVVMLSSQSQTLQTHTWCLGFSLKPRAAVLHSTDIKAVFVYHFSYISLMMRFSLTDCTVSSVCCAASGRMAACFCIAGFLSQPMTISLMFSGFSGCFDIIILNCFSVVSSFCISNVISYSLGAWEYL